MSFITTSVTRSTANVIHRFPISGKAEKNFAKFFSEKLGDKVTVEQLTAMNKKHLAACKEGAALPAGAKLLPNGRVSLRNNYYGRGYLDQDRSPVTGQTIHEIQETYRRVAEPTEGFKLGGPHFLAQIYDPKQVLKRFYWTVFYGFLAGVLWATLYRINDNAMFKEWNDTYHLHLSYHRKYQAELAEKRAAEGFEYDTAPVTGGSANVLLPLK